MDEDRQQWPTGGLDQGADNGADRAADKSADKGAEAAPGGDLDTRLRAAREAFDAANRKKPASAPTMLGVGYRLGVEMFSALLVAGAIGFAIDYWLDTAPWGLITLALLGIGAGVSNVVRVSRSLFDESRG